MDLDVSGRDLFDMAHQCIEGEDLINAKKLIERSVMQAPMNKYVIARAVMEYGYAELYSSALPVFENFSDKEVLLPLLDYRYEGAFVPRLIYTHEEIVQDEKDNLMVRDVPVFDLKQGPIRFKRLSGTERVPVSYGTTTPTPVDLIEVSEHGLAITRCKIKYAYRWNEITRASIVSRMIFRRVYGNRFYASQKICTLEAPGKLFQFDVSSSFPDFRGALLLRCILAQYVDLEIIDERKPGFKLAKNDPIRNLRRSDRIKQWLKVGAIALFI